MTVELPPTDPEEAIAELRARIQELEAELSAERASKTTIDGELTGLRAQLAALQRPAPAPAKRKRIDGFFEVDDDD